MLSCPKCGKSIPEDSNFCYFCGYNLKQPPTLTSEEKSKAKPKLSEEEIKLLKENLVSFLRKFIEFENKTTYTIRIMEVNFEIIINAMNTFKQVSPDFYKIFCDAEVTKLVGELEAENAAYEAAMADMGNLAKRLSSELHKICAEKM